MCPYPLYYIYDEHISKYISFYMVLKHILRINAPRDQFPMGSMPRGINATWDLCHVGSIPVGSMLRGINATLDGCPWFETPGMNRHIGSMHHGINDP